MQKEKERLCSSAEGRGLPECLSAFLTTTTTTTSTVAPMATTAAVDTLCNSVDAALPEDSAGCGGNVTEIFNGLKK